MRWNFLLLQYEDLHQDVCDYNEALPSQDQVILATPCLALGLAAPQVVPLHYVLISKRLHHLSKAMLCTSTFALSPNWQGSECLRGHYTTFLNSNSGPLNRTFSENWPFAVPGEPVRRSPHRVEEKCKDVQYAPDDRIVVRRGPRVQWWWQAAQRGAMSCPAVAR